MKIYVNTIPKSGTYFMAEFLEGLGYRNTGLHVAYDHVLRTKDHSLRVNVETPSKTAEKCPYRDAISGLAPGDVAFGHFPVALRPLRFPDLFFVCCYRHPRKTLMSEFVDFRFRRKDVGWIAPDEIADDRAAFVTYLRHQGPVQMEKWQDLLRAAWLVRLHWPGFSRRRYFFCNFDDMIAGEAPATRLAIALGADPSRVPAALSTALAAETKTKATDLNLDRNAFWSDEAEVAYRALGADRMVRRGRRLGWHV